VVQGVKRFLLAEGKALGANLIPDPINFQMVVVSKAVIGTGSGLSQGHTEEFSAYEVV
jgi:hypothetical protein